jgi:spermidine synthase
MALLYSKQTADSLYEVRSAGASLRLYSNGVLHSQYNKNTPINGAIWDLLLLPGFLAPSPPKYILVLGLGGGTIVHLLRRFFPESHITCVELDKEHITIAKQFFVIPNDNVKVVHADAYEFLKGTINTDQKYDWIIDDVFQHGSGEPERADDINELAAIYVGCLQKNGLLSINVITKQQKKQVKELAQSFMCAYQFNHPLYENSIVSLNLFDACTAQFRVNLKQHKMLDQSYKTCKLNYRLKRYL